MEPNAIGYSTRRNFGKQRLKLKLSNFRTCFLGVGGADKERASAIFLTDLRPRILTLDISSPESDDSWSLLSGLTPKAAEAGRFVPICNIEKISSFETFSPGVGKLLHVIL